MKLSRVASLTLMCAVVGATSSYAQATRTWVSGVGDDANPCSRTAPCKTYAGAISKTAAGGEISTLDPGGFGGVTITKAITINGDGTLAGILSAGTNGIIVNAGVNDHVIIRNLSINGAGTGLNGIRYLAGKQLTVDNVTISGVTNRGIDVSVATGRLVVKNTTIQKTATGIFLSATTAGGLQSILDNVTLTGNTTGLEAGTNGRTTITNSNISGNGLSGSGNGILASTSSSIVNADRCTVTFNAPTGINAAVAGATLRLSGNEIVNNAVGLNIAANAVIESAADNRIAGNVSNVVNPLPTPIGVLNKL